MSVPADLRALARSAGLLVDWEDADGRDQTVSADSLHQILAAMGFAAGTAAEIADSRARLEREQAEAARGFATADVGEPVELAGETARGRARLRLEDGTVRDVTLSASADGARMPAVETPGYHRLELADREMILAVAPKRAYGIEAAAAGRIWAPAVQVYSLRDERNTPYGDFGALARFAAEAGRRGADAVAISPVHALFAADPNRYGPYGPSSRLFLNGLYADPAAVFGAEALPFEAPEPAGDLVDWAHALPAQLARLRALHGRFQSETEGPRRADFQAFVAEGGPDLAAHAAFEALHGHFFETDGASGWQAWPEPYQDPSSTAVAQFVREHRSEVDFHLFLQWLAHRSLQAAQSAGRDAGMAIGLVTDLAVGMDAGGSHAWSRPQDILRGLSIGAPPDLFQAEGQDWGISAFSPLALRKSGFEAYLQTLRAAMGHAGGVRIDHVIGLQRLWVVPHGAGPKQGAYLQYPLQDLMRLLALESRCAQAIVIGEDLGTVPRGFRERMDARGMLGMRVLWFEREEDQGFIPAKRWSEHAAAMTSTHDLPTVAGWWTGRDIDWAERLGRKMEGDTEAEARALRQTGRERLWEACAQAGAAKGEAPPADEPERAVDAAVGLVASAPSRLALIPIEDLAGLTEQPNLPGTIDEHPNWRRRLPSDPKTLLGAEAVQPRLAALNARKRR